MKPSRIENLGLFRTTLIVAMVASAVWLLTVRPVCAQKDKEMRAKTSEVAKMLRDQQITNPQLFDQYFRTFFLKQFVSPTPPFSLDDLHAVRNALSTRFLKAGKSGPPHDRLNQLVLEELKKVVISRENYGEYDAAIRYNAILALGDLNEEDTPEGKPWQPALDTVLTKVVASKAVKDYLKVGALIGIERYATAKAITGAKATEVSKIMFDLVQQKEPPPGRDPSVHFSMRRIAAHILVSLGTLGPDNSVVAALTGILMNPQARPTVRCEVAQLLGELKYPVNAKVDFQALANYVGHETLDLCKREIDSAKADNRPPSKKMLAYVLNSASLGLEGNDGKGGLWAAAAAAPDNQKFIDTLRGKVKSLSNTLASADSDTEPLPSSALADLQAVLLPVPADKEAKQADAPAKPADGAKPAGDQAAASAKKVDR